MTAATQFFADPSLADQCFPGCGTLSFGNVIGKLAGNCAELKERLDAGELVQSMEAFEMSATNGFTSRVFRCSITLGHVANGNQEEHGKKPFPLIVKVFSMDRIDAMMDNFMGKENMEEMVKEMAKLEMEKREKNGDGQQADIDPLNKMHTMFARMHRNECALYELMMKSSAAGVEPPLPLPKVYFTQLGQADQSGEPGMILMEDMLNAHLGDIAQGLNEEQALAIVRHLANLHAHFMDPGVDNWQSHFRRAEEMFHEEGSEENSSKFFQNMMGQLGNTILDQMMVPLKQLGQVFQKREFSEWTRKRVEEELGVPEMLIHGDLWVNNLLWSNAEPNEPAAFIDWQLTMRGNPMTDIARLLMMSTECEVRHGLERGGRVLAHYLEALNAKLEEKGLERAKFGMEQLQHAYAIASIGQALTCAFVGPLFLRAWAGQPDLEIRIGKIMQRAVKALEDGLKAIEEEAPEWLLPLEGEEEGKSRGNGGGEAEGIVGQTIEPGA